MESILLKAAEQVPNLAVLTFIVWLFLKDRQSQSEATLNRFEEMHQDEKVAREKSRDVIDKNTAAVAANSEVMRETTQAYRELVSKCKTNSL